MWERGAQAAQITRDLLDGGTAKNFVAKLPILSPPITQATNDEPMKALLEMARSAEEHPDITCISLFPGFPYADTERAGFTIVVTANPQRPEAGIHVLHEITRAVEMRAGALHVQRPRPAQAVAQAIATRSRPIVLADVADNVGGGGPGDGTAILSELLLQGAPNAGVLITDAEVARRAAAVGLGRRIRCMVGGKSDMLHGEPVLIDGVVRSVSDGIYRARGSWMTGQEFNMGTTCLIQCGGVKLVVMERATPPFHGEQLECVGASPSTFDIIAVKGAIAWRAAYGEVAKTAIEVDGPGCCPVDPRVLPRDSTPVRHVDSLPRSGLDPGMG